MPVSVSTSMAQMCVPWGKEKFTGSKVASASIEGSMPSGKLCAAKVASAISWMRHAGAGRAPHGELPARELEVVLAGLQQVRGDLAGLGDHLLRGLDHRGAADHQRPGAVGVQAARGDRGVAVQHLDVLERDAELVGDELAPRRLVALPVRGRAGDDLDLAGGQHPDGGVLPAAGAVGQRAEHPGRRQPAHLGEGGEADAQLDRVVRLAAAALLLAQLVVAEQLQRLLGRRARSRRCRTRARRPW